VPELLLVATTAGLDARDLVRALERVAPEGLTIRSAPGLLAADRDGGAFVPRALGRAVRPWSLSPRPGPTSPTTRC